MYILGFDGFMLAGFNSVDGSAMSVYFKQTASTLGLSKKIWLTFLKLLSVA